MKNFTTEQLAATLACPSWAFYKQQEGFNFKYLRYNDRIGEVIVSMIELMVSIKYYLPNKKLNYREEVTPTSLIHRWESALRRFKIIGDTDKKVLGWNIFHTFYKKVLDNFLPDNDLGKIFKVVYNNVHWVSDTAYMTSKLSILGKGHNKEDKVVQFVIRNEFLPDPLWERYLFFYCLATLKTARESQELAKVGSITFYILPNYKSSNIAERIVFRTDLLDKDPKVIDSLLENGINNILSKKHVMSSLIECRYEGCEFFNKCSQLSKHFYTQRELINDPAHKLGL